MSVTGIFVLLALIMAMALSTRTQNASASPSRELIEELQDAIASAREQLARLRNQLAQASAASDQVGTHTQRTAEASIDAARQDIELLQTLIERLDAQRLQIEERAKGVAAALEGRSVEIQELEDLQTLRVALEAELTDLQQSHRVFYNESDESGRRIVLIELMASEFLVAEVGIDRPPLRFEGKTRQKAVLKWIDGAHRLGTRFVLIVHRGSAEEFTTLQEELRSRGHSIGYDLLPDDRIAIDLEHGAG